MSRKDIRLEISELDKYLKNVKKRLATIRILKSQSTLDPNILHEYESKQHKLRKARARKTRLERELVSERIMKYDAYDHNDFVVSDDDIAFEEKKSSLDIIEEQLERYSKKL